MTWSAFLLAALKALPALISLVAAIKTSADAATNRGLGYDQAVADTLLQPDSNQAKAILGSANLITAAVCRLTSDQPASVCSSATIQALEKSLG